MLVLMCFLPGLLPNGESSFDRQLKTIDPQFTRVSFIIDLI